MSTDRKNIYIAAGLGFLIGFIVRDQLEQQQRLTPEKALAVAKETFQKNWPITGSWIYVKPERIEKNGLTYETYRGGISRSVDGENKQFGFHVDIETGAIIDVRELDV